MEYPWKQMLYNLWDEVLDEFPDKLRQRIPNLEKVDAFIKLKKKTKNSNWVFEYQVSIESSGILTSE